MPHRLGIKGIVNLGWVWLFSGCQEQKGTSTAEYHRGNEIYSTRRINLDSGGAGRSNACSRSRAVSCMCCHFLPVTNSIEWWAQSERGGIRSCQRLDVLCICFRAFRRVKETFSVSSNGREEKVSGYELRGSGGQEIGRPRLDLRIQS